jgi:hypothetical protein
MKMRQLLEGARKTLADLRCKRFFEPLTAGDVRTLGRIADDERWDPNTLFLVVGLTERAIAAGLASPNLTWETGRAMRRLHHRYCTDTGIIMLRQESRAFDHEITALCHSLDSAATTFGHPAPTT